MTLNRLFHKVFGEALIPMGFKTYQNAFIKLDSENEMYSIVNLITKPIVIPTQRDYDISFGIFPLAYHRPFFYSPKPSININIFSHLIWTSLWQVCRVLDNRQSVYWTHNFISFQESAAEMQDAWNSFEKWGLPLFQETDSEKCFDHYIALKRQILPDSLTPPAEISVLLSFGRYEDALLAIKKNIEALENRKISANNPEIVFTRQKAEIDMYKKKLALLENKDYAPLLEEVRELKEAQLQDLKRILKLKP